MKDLMLKRYRLEIEYPDCGRSKGHIYELDESGWYCVGKDKFLVGSSYMGSYPDIFAPLQWWEEREFCDMPQYVKGKYSDYVVKVGKWLGNNFSGQQVLERKDINGKIIRQCVTELLPATESDYLEYTNTLKQTK